MNSYKKEFVPSELVCCKRIDIEVDALGIIQNVRFYGGCNGNLKGLSILLHGMHLTEARTKLQGLRCGKKNTSCPDQLSLALQEVEVEIQTAALGDGVLPLSCVGAKDGIPLLND